MVSTRQYSSSSSVREGGGKMSDREKTLENKAVADRDAELMRKLRDSLKLKVRMHAFF